MKYLDEYRNPRLASAVIDEIRRIQTRPWVIMEVCGGQTHSIVKHGIDRMLPDGIELVIGLPKAVFAGVAANAQHTMLTKPAHQLDELPVIACEETGIAELRRLITETGEVFGNATASRLAERHGNRQRSSLRKQSGRGVHRSRAECREGEKATPVHRGHSITGSSGQAKPPAADHLYDR